MEWPKPFFDGWAGLADVLIGAPIMYLAVIAFVRLAGKRSTSQMNNFDWVVTVALGSIIASGIIVEGVSIAEALLATGLLLAGQWVVTRNILRYDWLGNLVKADPRLLVHQGAYLRHALIAERVTEAEIMSAIRANGLTDVTQVQYVILETDATFSVIPKGERDFSNVELGGVSGFPPRDMKT